MINVKTPQPKKNKALIGYNNLLNDSTFAPARVCVVPNTYDRWAQNNNNDMVARFNLAQTSTINYFAIAAHTIFSKGSGVLQFATASSIGGAMTLRKSITFTGDDAVMVYFDTPIENVAQIQVFIPEADTNEVQEVGVLYCGMALEMERSIYGGHSPMDLSAKTDYQNDMSETGQFLGRTIKSKGTETSFQWRHLSPDWYRSTFQPFVDSAKTKPFFIQWRPDLYDVTQFGYTMEDIKPTNMGGGNALMIVGFNMRGHSD